MWEIPEQPTDAMNVHHLELFYYVARHGGITEAVRNIPYGIQQPAVSGQVAQLEENLGVTLFQRRPFALTAAGEKLYRHIQPFFSGLPTLADELREGRSQLVRIGASGIVLREHLPDLFMSIRKKYRNLKVVLRQGYQADLEGMLQRDELDLAVTILEKKSPPGIQSLGLLELPLVLLVHAASPWKSAQELWARDRIEEPLICLPAHETMCKHFQQGLARAGVDWFPGMEVGALELIEVYVVNGFGIGLAFDIPKAKWPPQVRLLPLPGFAPVQLGALWRGKPAAIIQAFLDEMQLRARRLLS